MENGANYDTRRRFRVLCADDEVSVSGWVAETLRHHGFQCDTAVDGHHALYKLAVDEEGYDLLITDARMPHLDGWGLILRARASGFRGPVIVHSGSLDATERHRYEALEVDRILDKPTSASALMSVIKDAQYDS